ncbi:MAG: hypothetical protein FJ027_20910 [Candidatus Rokubacteria bacterium]|nr:hypothetical protein [Candidatus Rokubacteria bacterium]
MKAAAALHAAALSPILGTVRYRDEYRQRRNRRHPVRGFFRRLRKSFRGLGLALLLALIVAAALVWAVMPAAETTYSAIKSVPGAFGAAELQRKAKESMESGTR